MRMVKRLDRLFIDTGISGEETVDVFTWTDATLIRLLQLPNGFVNNKVNV